MSIIKSFSLTKIDRESLQSSLLAQLGDCCMEEGIKKPSENARAKISKYLDRYFKDKPHAKLWSVVSAKAIKAGNELVVMRIHGTNASHELVIRAEDPVNKYAPEAPKNFEKFKVETRDTPHDPEMVSGVLSQQESASQQYVHLGQKLSDYKARTVLANIREQRADLLDAIGVKMVIGRTCNDDGASYVPVTLTARSWAGLNQEQLDGVFSKLGEDLEALISDKNAALDPRRISDVIPPKRAPRFDGDDIHHRQMAGYAPSYKRRLMDETDAEIIGDAVAEQGTLGL